MRRASALRRLPRNVFHGWWVLAASTAFNFFGHGIHTNGFPNYFLPLTRDLGLSRARTSIVFAATRLESGVEGPFVGWAIDKFGPRPVMLAGVVLAVAGYILIGTVVHGFWSLFLVYVFVLSLGVSAGFFPPISTAINQWFIRRRGVANGTLVGGFRLGGVVFAPLTAFMVIHLGWQAAAITTGVIMLVTLLPPTFVIRASPESMGLRPDGDPPVGDAPAGEAAGRRRTVRSTVDFTVGQALRTPTFWVYTVANGLKMLASGSIMVHMIPMLVWKGVDQQAAATMFGLISLVALPCSLLWGMVADRWPSHRVYGVSVAVSALGLAILTWSTTPWYLYLFVLCWGVADGAVPVMITITGDLFGRRSFATLRGIQSSIFALLGFATPIFAGVVYDRTGSYFWALLPALLGTVASLPLYFFLPRPRLPVAAPDPTQRSAPEALP
ncbi:MAG: MFS transporter [SAR202 cluster bacterium]|nr:MFS transporter [SAR202 cluster bacterium]